MKKTVSPIFFIGFMVYQTAVGVIATTGKREGERA
jgi:hypothetical protein